MVSLSLSLSLSVCVCVCVCCTRAKSVKLALQGDGPRGMTNGSAKRRNTHRRCGKHSSGQGSLAVVLRWKHLSIFAVNFSNFTYCTAFCFPSRIHRAGEGDQRARKQTMTMFHIIRGLSIQPTHKMGNGLMRMPVVAIATAASPLPPPHADAPPHPRGPCRRPLPEHQTGSPIATPDRRSPLRAMQRRSWLEPRRSGVVWCACAHTTLVDYGTLLTASLR